MRTLIAVGTAVCVVLTGCTKPTEVVIPSDVSQWDKLAPTIKKLPEEDQKALQAYLIRVKLSEAFSKGAGMPIGTTIGKALEDQRKWEAEQAVILAAERAKAAEAQALKEKLEAEEAAARAKMMNAVTVTLLRKEQEPSNPRAGRYSDRQTFAIGVANKAEKTIVGVSGKLEFIDLFDKTVGSVIFDISEPIQPGFDVRWNGSRDYNQFIPEHRAVWNLEEGQYTTKFTPDTIVFADGTKLRAKR